MHAYYPPIETPATAEYVLAVLRDVCRQELQMTTLPGTGLFKFRLDKQGIIG